MAPLHQAINTEFAFKEEGQNGRAVYRGAMDKDWSVLFVPHGGYVIAQVLEATIKHQESTPHPDPIHVVTYFMRASVIGPFEVYVLDVKTGRDLKHLSAALVQNNEEKIVVQMIFGKLEPTADPGYREPMTLEPPSPYAVYTPMQTHPSQCQPSEQWSLPRHNFRHLIRAAADPVYAKKRETPQRGLQWGDYFTLNDERESLRPSMVAFFADMFASYAFRMYGIDNPTIWPPSIVITIEFKFPLPKPTDPHTSQRTVAVFTQSRFMNEPNARHDAVIEVWTAPSDVGDGKLPANDSWKEHQRCLAVSTQMAIVLPVALNQKQGTKGKL